MPQYFHGDAVLIYIREDIPSRIITYHMAFREILLNWSWEKKSGYFLGRTMYLANQISISLKTSERGIDMYSKFYERYMLIGDFNAEESEHSLLWFLFEVNTKTFVKKPTRYKSFSNPSCIDLVITNSSSSF